MTFRFCEGLLGAMVYTPPSKEGVYYDTIRWMLHLHIWDYSEALLVLVVDLVTFFETGFRCQFGP